MAVLVTGGAGYIGSHMVLKLLDDGEKPVVLDDLSTGHKWVVPKDVPLFIGKVGNEPLVKSIIESFSIETIIHFAASIVIHDSVINPFHYYENNTANSRALFAAAVKAGVRNIVLSSSAAVYGEPAILPVPEAAPKAPLSPYGSSKLMTEIMLEDAKRAHGIRHVTLRYFNVAGADPLGRAGQTGRHATHIVKVACQAAAGIREGVSIHGDDYNTADGTCVRDYVHVTDLVNAHAAALAHLRKGGESLTLNAGYGHGFSVREVLNAVRRVSGVRFKVTGGPRRAGDPAALVADTRLIRGALDWRPVHDDLDRIVAHALSWEKRLLQRNAATHRELRLRTPLTSAIQSLFPREEGEASVLAKVY